MGISAGAALSAKYMGMYNESGIFTAYGSLSNPFNLTRVCFHMDNMFWGRIVSKFMVSESKQLINNLRENPVFQEILKNNQLDTQEAEINLSDANTYWELNAKYMYRMGGELVSHY